jgi:ABC-type branched-subunit amino acid transport system substrate-binding protein
MFSFAYTAGTPTDTHGIFARSRGGTRAVVLRTGLSSGASSSSDRFVQSLRAAGIPVLATLDFTMGADSPSAIAAQIAASGADTILSIIEPGAFVEILDALRAIGRSPKVAMSLSGYSDQMLRTYGAGAAGVVVPLFYRPFESGGPAIQRYLDAMARYAPQIPAHQDVPMMSYISTDMFLRGLELAGPCPTRRGFIDALHSVTNYDAGGLITPLNVRDEFGKPTTCYAFTQVNPQGNAFTVAEQRLCGKSLAP